VQKTVDVPDGVQKRISAFIQENGLKSTSKLLDLNEKTILRLAAGVSTTAGTIALVNAALRRLKMAKTPDNSGVR
jgi:hypothetical protein